VQAVALPPAMHWPRNRMPLATITSITVFLVMLLCPPLHAWDSMGHTLVALVAESRVTSATRAAICALLEQEALGDVASWADHVRTKQTAPWHYVNIEIEETQYEPDRHCPEQQCVIGQIERFRHTLGDPSMDIEKRREALKYVVHFVADLHQPLHAGQRHDRGGNDVKVEFLGQIFNPATKKPWNLHQVWDNGLLSRYAPGASQAVQQLNQWLATQDENVLAQGSVVEWATESHNMARDQVYTFSSLNRLNEDYVSRMLPIVEAQLAKAGVRLAAILNQALAPR
jgi:hypothetical protein